MDYEVDGEAPLRGLPVFEDGVLPELPKAIVEEVVHEAAHEAFDDYYWLSVETLILGVVGALSIVLRTKLLSGARKIITWLKNLGN
jgi:hypothetical protein